MSRLVSVIITARDAEAFVVHAVASCLAQTWRELEVVVLDDGSRDRTPDLVAAIPDSRVRLVRHERPVGLDVLHNEGLALTRGALVARLDADDAMLPTRLARQVAWLDAHPDHGLVGTNALVLERGRAPRLFYHYTGRALHWALHAGCPLLHPTVLLRRDALPPGGYPRGTRFSHDWGLFLRMGRTTRLAMLREPSILYRRHPAAVGVGHSAAQHASGRAVLARHLDEALGLRPHPTSVAAWVHPWTADAVVDARDLAALAAALAPARADLGPAAPAWDAPDLARCRRDYTRRLVRMLRAARWRRDVTRHLAPVLARALRDLARGAILG